MSLRTKQLIWIGGLSAAAAAALVLFCFEPGRVPIYPRCVFHQVTGMDCPGCGSLRALHELLHGHLWTALQLNALAILSLPLLGWLAWRFAWRELKGGPAVVVRPVWLWLYLAAWVTFGLVRFLRSPFVAMLDP